MTTAMREVTFQLPEEIVELLTQAAGQRALTQDAVVAESLRYTLQLLTPQPLGAFCYPLQNQRVDPESVSNKIQILAQMEGWVDCIRGKVAYLTMQDSAGRTIEATYDAKCLREQIGTSTYFLCEIVAQEPRPVVVFRAAEEPRPTKEELLQRHEELQAKFASSRERWKKPQRK